MNEVGKAKKGEGRTVSGKRTGRLYRTSIHLSISPTPRAEIISRTLVGPPRA